VTAVLIVTLILVRHADKPSGARLLGNSPRQAIWQMERWEAQAVLRFEMKPVLRFLEEQVPPKATLALAIGEDDFGYPAFGPRLERRIELVSFGSAADDVDADWLLASRERAREIDPTCWQMVFRSSGGVVFARTRRACG
jgi:hypothetical protein